MTVNQEQEREQILKKYAEERDKRLREDGSDQYIQMKGDFARYTDDPFVERVDRDPIQRDVDVAVLGGGYGGLLAAARLKQAGVTEVCLIDKAGDFGGTWYWNRYPGIACDTESYIYLPLLEEVKTVPKANFASGEECLEHARAIGRHFDLYHLAMFQTEVLKAEWDDEEARWLITTDRNDKLRARFFIIATGGTFSGKLPGIPGIEKFKGVSFHTNRWDFEYTGGDSNGNLTKLQDKRVAIIGTGASGIQAIPHLGKWAKQLYVFQRTPSAVDYRNEHPTDMEWYKSLKPGWQRERMYNFSNIVLGGVLGGVEVEKDLVNDGWTKPNMRMMKKMKPDMSVMEKAAMLGEADFEVMDSIRSRVDDVVKDEATAEALKPWYQRLCKRPTFHDEYLQTFNRPNVTLVQTEGHGVEAITEKGVVVAGKEYEVDCIIYASGFTMPYQRDEPLYVPLYGRGGISVAEKWKDGATTMHGFHIHRFPNLYNMSGQQAALSPNYGQMLNEMAIHTAYVISEVMKRGAVAAEVSAKAESDWVAHHDSVGNWAAGLWKDCTPGYYNNEGQIEKAGRSYTYGGGVNKYVEILEEWRAKGDLEGLELRMPEAASVKKEAEVIA